MQQDQDRRFRTYHQKCRTGYGPLFTKSIQPTLDLPTESPALSRAPLLQHLGQLLYPDRFDQMQIEARPGAACAVFRLAPSRPHA
jgi:hypothetical protein